MDTAGSLRFLPWVVGGFREFVPYALSLTACSRPMTRSLHNVCSQQIHNPRDLCVSFANVMINELDVTCVSRIAWSPSCVHAQARASVSLGAAGGMGSPPCLHLLPPPAGRPGPPEAERGRKEGSWAMGEWGGLIPLLGWLCSLSWW